MFNPYEHIEQRLDKLEALLMQMMDVLEKHTSKNAEPMKNILSIKEAAKYLNLSASCLYTYAREKKIPFSKMIGRLYFHREDLDQWVKQGKVKTALEIKEEAVEFIRNRKKKRR